MCLKNNFLLHYGEGRRGRGRPTPEASWQIICSQILSEVFLKGYHKIKMRRVMPSFVVI